MYVSGRHRHRSRSPASPLGRSNVYESGRDRERERESREKRHKHHHHKRHKERRAKHHSRDNGRDDNRTVVIDDDDDDYHSDSSDVIEVPIAPPAPIISRQPPEPERERIKEREKEREREREQRERERERDRERERERERDREREREREKERERGNQHESQKSRSHSPIPENGAGDCLSIEETNKLRAKLGLKPLEVESSTSVSKDTSAKKNEEELKSFKDEWGEFLHKPATNLKEKLETEKMRAKLQERKEKRALEDKLKRIQSLGESDDEVDDVNKWVSRSKKREEEIQAAQRRAKLLEEMDAEFGVGNIVDEETRRVRNNAYKDRDLKGLRVEHDIDEFTEGRSVILTLKDKDVLDENDDTLVNVNLVDEERYRKNVENRKQKPNAYGYDVYEETVDEFGNPIERSILNKYDDEIEGGKKKSFTIGENIDEERAHQRKLLEIKTKLAGKRLESLNVETLKLASDTYTETEMEKFKKPKKKVKKLRQKLKAEDLLPLPGQDSASQSDLGRRGRNRGSVLDTDDVPDIPEDISKVKVEDETEDDLERVLSKARKLKQKESIIKKSIPIDVTQIKTEIKAEADSDEEMTDTKDGNIILNATAEFCRTLGDIPTYGMAGNREEDTNDMMDFEQESIEPDLPLDIKPASSTGTWNSVNPDTVVRVSSEDIANDIAEVAILDEEPDVGEGVAAALRLAMSKGYLEKEDTNRPSNSRMAHLQAKNYSIEDKAYGEEDKFGRRDRYHSGPIMEFREKETFKPNVKLEYIDDNGRVLNAKEAFRYLSHKFHGKGPGKNKIEKRLKKMEQDGLMMKMSSTDTPLGTLSMLQQKQKETQTPYVVLSGSKQNHASTSISKHK